ncbi:RNA-directed DNA polymerase, eukaryota, reverse transcriptase zinc-binding domain protein [Tanacetum coccineum]
MKFLTGVYIMGHRRSDVDEVQKISTSIFVTNFPDQFYAKDLWKVCNQYGNVVDAFILNRRSKSVKEFGSLTNLKVVLANEGFDNIKLKYMGGYWVMIEFQTEDSKERFKANVGIGSWFSQLEQASNLFHIDERVTWVDIKGIPLKVWTKNTFNRIASKLGDLLHVEDQDEGYFNSKRFCIKTKLVDNIFESFKTITQGKVFWVRAKEVSGWIPNFVEDDEEESDTDDEIRDEELHNKCAVYSPQDLSEKKMLYDYLTTVIDKWNGEVEHLKMEMEIPCSNKIKFITACSFSNDSFEDIMKAQVSVIKASATLNIQAFKIKKSVSISFRMTQVHKMAKDHMMMIRDYDWMMISKKLKDHIQVKLKPKSMFRGISMGMSLHLSHLFYADDAIFTGHWSDLNIDTIVQVLECFYRAPGLCINMNKSKLMGILVVNVIVDQAAIEIVNNLVARLSNWKMKTLSIGGRLTLLNLVLGSMPIYHMSLFKVPMKVLPRMESIRCYFFNGVDHNGKKPKVLASKEKGGLGIHGENGKLGKNVNHSHPSIWLDIVRDMEQLMNHVKVSHENVGYSLHQIPRGGIEQVHFLEFSASIEGDDLVDIRDRWVWSLDGSGEFTAASVQRLIDEHWLLEVSTKTRWINVVPIKVNVHA